MPKRLRNRGCMPDLSTEGRFERPMDTPPPNKELSPWERAHAHQTLASARRYAYFKPFSGLIPRDELDLVLASPYDHTYDIFPDPMDVYLQEETMGKGTWRCLRNTLEYRPAVEARANVEQRKKHVVTKLPYKLNGVHPVLVGGILQKIHPSNVKLMNSSHHSPQTNGGYSRQDSDGNFYQY